MGRRIVKFQIEGHNFEITQLGAVEGRQLSILFIQVVGPLVSGLVKNQDIVKAVSAGKESEAGNAILEAMGDLTDALQNVDPKRLEPLWDAFSENAWIVGNNTRQQVKAVFDEHFAGDGQFAMWRFFIESAKANFAGFLAKAGGNAASAKGPSA
jgi:hypothetical protein